MSLANNVEFLRRLPKLNGFNALGGLGRNPRPGIRSPLIENRRGIYGMVKWEF